MDFCLRYTQRALNDLAQIIGYIAEDDTAGASRFGSSLLDHLELLTRFPRMGSPIARRPQVRKLLHRQILVYYQIHDAKRIIEVLHLRHASRKPPKSLR